jgi:N-methylhydantoinase A
VTALEQARVEAVAVCYLHSYRDARHERLTRRALSARLPRVFVSLSSEVLAQIKEYERFCTTVVNAYVGPALGRYLGRLQDRLRGASYRGPLLIMQSHGGVATVADSVRLAAGAVLSGPAGGVAAGRHAGERSGAGNLITFDMGGTSTDIALLEGGLPQLTGDKAVAGHKVALPSIDIHTLGAGGGSIARVDAGGILHVGPESAGADPGPAAYGRGGHDATVTDANVVLGLLDPGSFLGGAMRLDGRAAHAAVGRAAQALGVTPVEAARGIQRVVNTNMAEGIRLVSVRRGADPRRFALLSFGGAAGLHVTAVARMLEIARVLVPRTASVLSAWGMLATDLRYEFVRTHVGEAGRVGAARLRRLFADMEQEGRRRLGADFPGEVVARPSVDMRYGEQTFEIQVSLDGLDLAGPDLMARAVERFHRRHEELYAWSAPGQEVVLVNARLAVVGRLDSLPVEEPGVSRPTPTPARARRIYLDRWMEVPVLAFDGLAAGEELKGPAVVESATTTVLLGESERATVTPHGWLDVRLG